MTLYDQIAAEPDGGRRLARAELRYKALGALRRAIDAAGISQSDLAGRLGVRKSAVSQVLNGTGNVRVNTLAEYLYEAGYEADITIRPAAGTRAPSVACHRRPTSAKVIPVTSRKPEVQRTSRRIPSAESPWAQVS